MWKFYVKLGVFCLLFLLADRLAGEAMSAYSRLLAPDQRIGKVLAGEIDHELIVLGSSRAARNLVAEEIEAGAGLTSYNLGAPGSNIDFHLQMLELLLSTAHIPRYLLLTVDSTEVKDDPFINFRFDLLYPYSSDARICEILVARGQLNKQLSDLFFSYREKLGFIEVFRPYALFSKPFDVIKADGSIPLPGHSVVYEKMRYGDGLSQYSMADESPRLKGEFAEFVHLCKKNNIQLVLIFSPNFSKPMAGLAERLQTLAGEEVLSLDYSSRPEFFRKELFFDGAHLNSDGALLLSRMVGADLRKIVPQ